MIKFTPEELHQINADMPRDLEVSMSYDSFIEYKDGDEMDRAYYNIITEFSNSDYSKESLIKIFADNKTKHEFVEDEIWIEEYYQHFSTKYFNDRMRQYIDD